jgi:ribosomal protein S18 acetylase RimI-like enzyme
MIQIIKATPKDFNLLINMGRTTFIEAHTTSGSKEDLDTYLNSVYNADSFKKELENANNNFYLIYYDSIPAGFSKIIINSPNQAIAEQAITKLDRIYIHKEFYDKKLGLELLNFNIKLSQQNTQKGMWLYVWVENQRAINFYNKIGFTIAGSYNFKLSETRSNPNHIMYLNY